MPGILTPLQHKVLHGLFQAGAGARGYFLTGGTALAEYYLGHRLSVDLDLFNHQDQPVGEALGWVEEVASSLGLAFLWTRTADATHWRAEFSEPGQEGVPLPVDFANDNVPAVGVPELHGDIVVDTFEDIAANKISAFYSRGDSDPKDLADLYFILRSRNWNLEYLLELARRKDGTFDDEEAWLYLAVGIRESVRPEAMATLLSRLRFPQPLDPGAMAELMDREATRIIRRLRPG